MPALLNFTASDYLVSIARRLVEILTSRSSSIAGMRRQKNQSLADFTAADIANFWLLYTINTAFPVFRHLFETRGGHPEALYSAMLSLAGALTTFSATIHPRDLPSYDHDDLGECFTQLDEKLRMLLETVVPSNFVSLPLKLVQPSIYATAIDNDKYLQNTKMYLAIGAEASQAEIVSKTPPLVKVCSASHIEHLVKNALAGRDADLRAEPAGRDSGEAELPILQPEPVRRGLGGDQRARNLAAYVPERSSQSAVRIDYPIASGQLMTQNSRSAGCGCTVLLMVALRAGGSAARDLHCMTRSRHDGTLTAGCRSGCPPPGRR